MTDTSEDRDVPLDPGARDLLEDRDGAPYPEEVQALWRRVGFDVPGEMVVSAIESVLDALRESGRLLGDEQCCPDVCNGGACETCVGCSAGWCVNGHDMTPADWDAMDAEAREVWTMTAREHNVGFDRALAELEPRRLDTDAQLHSVPARTVVRAADGTIAARYDDDHGVVFGDDRSFPWRNLRAPALVLWADGDPGAAPVVPSIEGGVR